MRPRVELWVEVDGRVVLSDWRVALLEAVAETGSLAQAAARLGTPYRTAWQRLRTMEARLGVRLVESHSGGAQGGGARLTPAAHRLVARYRAFAADPHADVGRRFSDAFGDDARAAEPAAPPTGPPTEPKVRRGHSAKG
jgi:molybdate transport system regulatory protein